MTDPDTGGQFRTRAVSLLAQRRTRLLIAAALLILALGVRVAAVQHYHYKPVFDGRSYLSLSGQIALSGDYWSTDLGAGGTRGPTAYFPPAFPYFLAISEVIDGHARGSKSPPNVHDVRIEQAVLGTITVALIGLVALELFGSGVALIALALAAIYPVMVELSTLVVAENLLVAFELAAVYSALRVRRTQTPTRWVVACGVFTGLAALTHTNGILLVIPTAIAMWNLKGASQAPSWARRHRWSAPLLLVLVTGITLTPWLIRDAVVMHTFVPISDEAGITLAGTYNATTAHERNPPWRWRFFASVPSLRRTAGHHQRTMTEPQLASRMESAALHYIGNNPATPLEVGFDNTLRLLELEGKRAQVISDASIGLTYGEAHLGVYSFWLLLVFAIGGLFTRAVRSVPRWLWLVPLLMWLSVVFVNAETPRFREPLEPFLILSAACAVAALARRVSAAFSQQPAPGGVSAPPDHAEGTVRPPEPDPAPS